MLAKLIGDIIACKAIQSLPKGRKPFIDQSKETIGKQRIKIFILVQVMATKRCFNTFRDPNIDEVQKDPLNSREI